MVNGDTQQQYCFSFKLRKKKEDIQGCVWALNQSLEVAVKTAGSSEKF